MKIEHAYRRAMKTVVKWIQEEVDSNKTQVFFRTFAPVHFRFVCNITCKKKRIFDQFFFIQVTYLIILGVEIGEPEEHVTWRHCLILEPL